MILEFCSLVELCRCYFVSLCLIWDGMGCESRFEEVRKIFVIG